MNNDPVYLGQLRSEMKRVSFTISNTGDQSGDYVVWIEDGGRRFCEKVFFFPADHSFDIAFSCPQIEGRFDLITNWAANLPDIAAIAERMG